MGMVDVAGDRHSHVLPTPRGGGAGLVLALLISSALVPAEQMTSGFWVFGLLPGFVVLSLVGWWDDRISLSAGFRFAVQLLVSIYMVYWLRQYESGMNLAVVLIVVLYLVWMINLYNFMDGSNGMAGLQGVFAGGMLGYLNFVAGDMEALVWSLLLLVVCVGFLPWNLGRARVFMGDVASGSLGFAFAALLLYGVINGNFSLAIAWMLMLVFMCDSTLTLVTRVLRGERWYNPHKQHLYQRLIACGWSHGSVLSLYQLINLVFITPGIVVAVHFPSLAAVIAVITTVVMTLGWLLVRQKLGVLAISGIKQ